MLNELNAAITGADAQLLGNIRFAFQTAHYYKLPIGDTLSTMLSDIQNKNDPCKNVDNAVNELKSGEKKKEEFSLKSQFSVLSELHETPTNVHFWNQYADDPHKPLNPIFIAMMKARRGAIAEIKTEDKEDKTETKEEKKEKNNCSNYRCFY